eukprot:7387876-Prymnesium_polylepis.1
MEQGQLPNRAMGKIALQQEEVRLRVQAEDLRTQAATMERLALETQSPANTKEQTATVIATAVDNAEESFPRHMWIPAPKFRMYSVGAEKPLSGVGYKIDQLADGVAAAGGHAYRAVSGFGIGVAKIGIAIPIGIVAGSKSVVDSGLYLSGEACLCSSNPALGVGECMRLTGYALQGNRVPLEQSGCCMSERRVKGWSGSGVVWQSGGTLQTGVGLDHNLGDVEYHTTLSPYETIDVIVPAG